MQYESAIVKLDLYDTRRTSSAILWAFRNSIHVMILFVFQYKYYDYVDWANVKS